MSDARQTLVFGGVRSGKSRLAEKLARARGEPGITIAAAPGGDAEIRARSTASPDASS